MSADQRPEQTTLMSVCKGLGRGCSSRARVLVSGFCRSVVSELIQRHGMGDGALRRRSIKLLCAGWRPHSVFRPGAIPV